MTKIKICGLKRRQDIELVNEVLPDYAGFIINYPKSHRSLSPLEVKELICCLDRKVQAVGVFVDSPIELPIRMLREGTITLAQLHGSEDESYIKEVKDRTGSAVIKAFPIRSRKDLEDARKSSADYILLDHGLGENGKVIDWPLFANMGRDFFLAGGLNADNAVLAIRAAAPFALDFNSGLETGQFKDGDKVRRAVKAVRECRD